MPAQMSIDEIKLLEAHYSIKPVDEENNSAEDEALPVKMDIICGNKYLNDRRNLIVTLELNCDSPSLPFKFNVKYGGSFNFSEDPTKEEFDRFAEVNCPALIYPYIREFVSEITRRGGNEPLFIPPMNFIDVHKKRKEEKSAEKGK